MEQIIEVIIEGLILNYLSLLCLREVFSLDEKKRYLLLLCVPSVMCLLCYSLLKLKFYQLIFLLTGSNILITILITDEYKSKRIFGIFFSYEIILFAVAGINKFLCEFFKVVFESYFHIKLTKFLDLAVFLFQTIFIFMIFKLTRYLTNQRKIKNFLSRVSFSLNGKHIVLTGLLDSGNSLYDDVTLAPVIVVSADILKNIFDDELFDEVICGNWNAVNVDGYVNFVSVGTIENESHLPVFRNITVSVDVAGRVQKRVCSVGFDSQIFKKKKFECIVHRDFV